MDTDPVGTKPGGVEPGSESGALEVRTAEWSVVAYDADGPVPAERDGFQVLATTSRADAESSIAELRGLRHRATVNRVAPRQSVSSDRGRTPQRRVAYHVAPGTECVRATLETSAPRFDPSVPRGASVFVRATVDAGGEVVAAELLHADRTRGAESAMVAF